MISRASPHAPVRLHAGLGTCREAIEIGLTTTHQKMNASSQAKCQKLRCPLPFNSSNCDAATKRAGLPSNTCDTYCAKLHSTPVYMGGIHPRLKRPVGVRLATAAFSLVYGGDGAVTGPTIAGCALAAGGKLTLTFDPVGPVPYVQ